jgi:hypothetical protein
MAEPYHITGEPGENHIKRFIGHTVRDENGCWNWQRFRDRDGYGKFQYRGVGWRAPRWIYEALRGRIPDGHHLDHLCRNRGCVNPDHLEPVLPRENWRRGEAHTLALADATHCVNGHEFTPENTHISTRRSGPGAGSERRSCKTCLHDRYVATRAADVGFFRRWKMLYQRDRKAGVPCGQRVTLAAVRRGLVTDRAPVPLPIREDVRPFQLPLLVA